MNFMRIRGLDFESEFKDFYKDGTQDIEKFKEYI